MHMLLSILVPLSVILPPSLLAAAFQTCSVHTSLHSVHSLYPESHRGWLRDWWWCICNQPLAQIQLCYFHWWRASMHDHECHMCVYLSKVSTQYLVECVVALLRWTGLAWWEQTPVIGELSLLGNALLQRVVTPISTVLWYTVCQLHCTG